MNVLDLDNNILDFYFRYLYFLMFGLFNAIYWTHVKMAADSSREPLAKNFAPGETEIN